MVLLLDLGNTNLFIGVYQNGELVCDYRTHADKNKSSDEYRLIISSFLKSQDLKVQDFEGAILSSVVPSLTLQIKNAIKNLLHLDCLVVGSSLKSGISIRIDNPSEMGSDMVADAVGGKKKYSYPLLVADLGTASKIVAVDKEGSIVGCVIMAGMKVSMNALNSNTAQLMDITMMAPKKVIGKNSPDSLNSGAVYGTIAMIEGLCKKMEDELGYKCNKILTGGYSVLVKDYIDKEFIYDPNLIFEGLYQIYLKNK